MKNREIIESYLNSIKDELMMYKDSLSEKSFPYIEKLKSAYNEWEKDLWCMEHKTSNDETEDEKIEIDNTEIDNSLYEAIDEFNAYIKYKEDYNVSGSQEKLDMSRAELGHFLSILSDVFDELHEHSQDDADERAMIKTSIKMIYQKFS